MKADILIVDGRHALYRSSDSFSDLSVEIMGKTIGTGGIYGFLGILQRTWQRYSGKLVVAWEGDGRNFRLGLYPSYKHKDEPVNELNKEFKAEMYRQEKMLWPLLRDMGVDQYFGCDCEADDVIARLTKQFSKEGKQVVIYSGDSDLRQLVKDGVVVAAHNHGGRGDTVYDEAAVLKRHGVKPNKIAQLKALSGDNSDNIPGVPNVGPVTAAKLLNSCHTLGGVLRAAVTGEGWPSTPRFRGLVKQHQRQVLLYYKLTKVRDGAAYKLLKGVASQAKVVQTLWRLKFRSFSSPSDLQDLMSMGKG